MALIVIGSCSVSVSVAGSAELCGSRRPQTFQRLWVLLAGYSEAAIAALRTEIPGKWERLGDLALLPNQAFLSHEWKALGTHLWDTVAAALSVARLGKQSPVANSGNLLLKVHPMNTTSSDIPWKCSSHVMRPHGH